MTGSMRADTAPRLRLTGVTKSYPGCLANDHVDLTLLPGEIHALLGENGAGKSTLVKTVYGLVRPDSGEIAWNGSPVEIESPSHARSLGIGMVFQHFSLFDSLSVVENIALGLDSDKTPMKQLADRVAEVSARYGLKLDPWRHVYSLSVGERQRVEIVRCLLQNPSLLIMDEPTSVLTPQEADALFETLRQLASEGCTVLYISHKLDEIRALCSKATIMRSGKVVATCDPRVETARSLAQMMIGSELRSPTRDGIGAGQKGDCRLSVSNLSLASPDPFGTDLQDVSFDVHAGEIFGIAGVAGNGQKTLMAALSGEALAPSPEAVTIETVPSGHIGPRRRRQMGLAAVPEERLGHSAVPDMTLADNALLSGYQRAGLVERGVVSFTRSRAFARRIIDAFDVVASGPKAVARSLSGGNLQKFIIGREILQKPKILIAAHPTWGVDAGAAAAIHQALLDLKKEGAAIVIVSQDLDELFAIADRVAVIFDGKLSKSLPVHNTSVEQVGLLMGGMFDAAIGNSGEAPLIAAEDGNADPA